MAAALLATNSAQPAAAETGPANAGTLWPWSSQNPPDPPKVRPFEVPTFGGVDRNFREAPAGWVRAPRVDGDAVFAMVIACYPERSRWRLDVDLQAALRNTAVVDIAGTNISRSYVGIVAKMPIYSGADLDREREREYKRRTETAQTVAAFVGSIARRNHAARAVGLAATMEARARVRVREGITEAAEQVGYLAQVADGERALIDAEAAIMAARLQLVGMCRDEAANSVNRYLSDLAQLPTEGRP